MSTPLSLSNILLGSLIGTYLFDLMKIRFVISPKNPFSKVIFRGSNCSYKSILLE